MFSIATFFPHASPGSCARPGQSVSSMGVSARWPQFHRLAYLAPLLLLALVHNARAAEFIPLGTLPGDQRSQAWGVSDDGVVGGTTRNEDNGTAEAFRWTDETGMVGLGMFPGGKWSQVAKRGVSGDGSTIVGSAQITGTPRQRSEAFIHTEADGMRSLGVLPGDETSAASAVSDDGTVVVGWSYDETFNNEAFRWTKADGMVGLGLLHGNRSRAEDVSADGSVIVGWIWSIPEEPFVWTEATGMVSLGFEGEARAVSSDGVVVGGEKITSESTRQAFRWTADTGAVGLGWIPGTEWEDGYGSGVTGINSDGSVIVGAGGPSYSELRAYIWTAESGMLDLKQLLIDQYGLGDSLEGWTLRAPEDISADGQFIVGIGTNPSGVEEGWLVRLSAPVPEPGSLALLVFGALSLLVHRRMAGR